MKILIMPSWFLLTVALTASLAGPALAKSNGESNTKVEAKRAVVGVNGMFCSLCAQRLEKLLAKLDGATAAHVELEKKEAVVTFAKGSPVTDRQIQETIRNAGFVPGRIAWNKPGQHDSGNSQDK